MFSNFGTTALRVPRRANPYLVARKLSRLARAEHPDLLLVRDVLTRRRKPEAARAASTHSDEPSNAVTLSMVEVDTPDPEPEGGAPPPAFADAVGLA
jgi:hypothetical protein